MSFGGGGGAGQVRYQITVEDAQAASKLQSVGQQFKALGTSTQGAAQQMSAIPQTFQTIVQEGNKVTTTTKQIQQTMQGTITTVTQSTKANQSFGDVLKSNVLSISIAASSIIGLITQYTQLRKAQVGAEKAALAETTTRNKVNDLTAKLAITVQKYGQNSTQAAKGARDLAVAEEKAGIAAERNAIVQQSLSERTADFAVNILPNVIGAVGSVTQVLQGFRKAEEVSTVVTVENSAAQIANAAAMKVSQGAAAGMVPPLKAVAGAQVQAGVAATGMGTAMRTALIRTGIGAILVGLGTLLVAFTQNWWGVRDSVNAAGVELGKIFPIIIPLLNGIKELGIWITKIFGGEVPGSTAKATAAMDEFGTEVDSTAADAIKAAEEIASAWKKTIDGLIVIPGAKHKEWQDQFKKLRDLGFSKSGIHELKDKFFRPAGIAKSITDSISQALQIVGKTKGLIGGETMRELSNNLIDGINKGMKDAKGQLDFLSPLKEIIKANKKNVDLPKLVADWFAGLPQALKDKLKDFGLDPNEIIKTLGFDPGKLSAALNNVWSQMGVPAEIGKTLDKGMDIWMGKGGGGKEGTATKGWVANIIDSIKTALSPASLESIRQQLVAGILAAPGNISNLVRNFIDPVLATIIDNMVKFGTEVAPQWIKSTFTFANIKSAISTIVSFGASLAAGIFAALSDPVGLVKGAVAFANAALGTIGAWLEASLPKSAPKFKAIGVAIVTAIKEGFLEFLANNPIVTWVPGFGGVGQILGKITQTTQQRVNAPPTPPNQPIGGSLIDKSGLSKAIGDAWKGFTDLFKGQGPQEAFGATGGGLGSFSGKAGAGLGAKAGVGVSVPNANMVQINNSKALQAVGVIAQNIANLAKIIPVIVVQTQKALQAVGVIALNIANLAQLKPMLQVVNSKALQAVGVIAQNIDSLAKLNPTLQVQNSKALKAVGVIAQNIENLAKLKPTLQVQNSKALKAVGVIANNIEKLAKLNPTLQVKNSSALKAVGVIAKNIMKLEDLNPTINVKVKTTGATGALKSFQKGFHGRLTEDTLFMAHAGERVDVGHGPKNSMYGSGGGGGGSGFGSGGNLTVNNIIDLGGTEIIRSFKRKLGSGVYAMGR